MKWITWNCILRNHSRVHVDFSRNGFCFWVGNPSKRRSCGKWFLWIDSLPMMVQNHRMMVLGMYGCWCWWTWNDIFFKSPLAGAQSKIAADLCMPEMFGQNNTGWLKKMSHKDFLLKSVLDVRFYFPICVLASEFQACFI